MNFAFFLMNFLQFLTCNYYYVIMSKQRILMMRQKINRRFSEQLPLICDFLFFNINLFDRTAEGVAHKNEGVLFKILCVVADKIFSFTYF